ncbi:MAG: hypothetical protein JXD21_03215 [Candidatus Omnitrophica bacterium]|nr:hypothetical protein [Candidatus Omnitrophota bacterium]
MNTKAPVGLIIFAGINTVLLGILPALLFLSIKLFLPAHFLEEVLQTLQAKESFLPAMDIRQFTVFLYIQAFMAVIFIVSGLGLFTRKEWARRFTIYYAFFMLIMVLAGIISAGKVMVQMWFNIVYPGALIFYFTNPKVGESFK